MSLSTCVPTCNAFICGCYLLILFLQHDQMAGMQVVDHRIREEVWDLTHATADTPSADLTDLKLFVDGTKPNLTPTPITDVKALLSAYLYLNQALDVKFANIQREINLIDTIVSEKYIYRPRVYLSAVNHDTMMRQAVLEIDQDITAAAALGNARQRFSAQTKSD